MHIPTLHCIILATVLAPAIALAAESKPSSNTAAAPDVTLMTQTVNPKAAMQNKPLTPLKAKRPATVTPAKATP